MGPRWRTLERFRPDVVLLAVVSYLPVLLSSPGQVSADSKQALYVDPERFLAGAASLWDPGIGAGTVPHQHIGYLWPMGPWFWVFEQLGAPDWVAQRLWLGTLTFVAALGARWLLRNLGAAPTTALAGALVYALSPYQLAFTARASVLLLPWVGLPWLVELTRRAIRDGRWRHPALAALVVLTVAGVNATSLVLIAVGPVAVVVHAVWSGAARRAVAAAARIGALAAGVSAFWLAGLAVQGSHGMPVLDLTENLSDVARWSAPADVARGLGNWFFAGRDRLGWSVDQAEPYLEDPVVVGLTLVVPCLVLAALVLVPGRIRLLGGALVSIAAVVAVGAWPPGSPSLAGRTFRWFAEETSVGLAFRNSHRIVPVLLLGAALLLAAAIERVPALAHRRVAAAGVSLVALAGLAPAMLGGLLSEHLDRPEELPSWWTEAADELDAGGVDGDGVPRRVLEVPGAPFAAYRWGNAVEPVGAALLDRPHLAREVLPYGSPATANLLDALDRRMQEGILEPEAVAPVARLFAAGEVVVRSDLQFERFRTPEPATFWHQITGGSGLSILSTHGPATANLPDAALAPVDERRLAHSSVAGHPVPPVGILGVADAPSVLHLRPARHPVLFEGDGDGIVDAAAAGLIDGTELIVYPAALDDAELDAALGAGASVVLTDTNRRRIQTWFYAIRDTRGPTERAGETLVEPTTYDVRLEPVPGLTDADRTVAEHLGGQVSATVGGTAARPEDRAISGFDGDLATAWRVGGPDPRGARLALGLEHPVPVGAIRLVQPQDGPRDRVVESVRIHLDGEAVHDVALDERSLRPEGQLVVLDRREIGHLELELTGVSTPPFDPAAANAVGFAEVQVAGIDVAETIVLPRALIARVGPALADHPLAVVLTRLRQDPFERGRTDPERHLDRVVELPGPRTFGVTGRARLSVDAPDEVLDDLLVTGGGVRAVASSRLAGDLTARAWAAIDGDPATAWIAGFGPQQGQWIELRFTEPTTVEELHLDLRVSEHHSVPTVVEVAAGDTVTRQEIQPAPAGSVEVARVAIPLEAPVRADRVRVTVVEVERRSAPPGDAAPMATLPVAIAAIGVPGMPHPGDPVDRIDTGCRSDLLHLGEGSIPVRIFGASEAARRDLQVEGCGEVRLDQGRNRLRSRPGHESGIDLDRIVLASGSRGDPVSGDAVLPEPSPAPAEIVEVDPGRTSWSGRVAVDGEPFWVVLAQSHSEGWRLAVDGRDVGGPTLVNGYANGWLVEPGQAGELELALVWTPQRIVSWGLGISAFTIGLCIGLAAGHGAPHVGGAEASPWDVTLLGSPPDPRRAAWFRPSPTTVVAAVGTALATAVVSRPWIGVVAGLVVLLVACAGSVRWVVAAAAPVALVAGTYTDRATLAWLALAVAAAGGIGDELRRRRGVTAGTTRSPRARGPRAARPIDRETEPPRPDRER